MFCFTQRKLGKFVDHKILTKFHSSKPNFFWTLNLSTWHQSWTKFMLHSLLTFYIWPTLNVTHAQMFNVSMHLKPECFCVQNVNGKLESTNVKLSGISADLMIYASSQNYVYSLNRMNFDQISICWLLSKRKINK